MATNRIDSTTPERMSTNLTVERQTPKTDFGTRVRGGMESVAGAVANGAAMAAPLIPGGAILSAAVSSVTHLGGNASSGAVAASYVAAGITSVGGGGINTTVGASGAATATTISGAPSYLPTGNTGGSSAAQMGSELTATQAESAKLLQVQIAMQRENQVFTSVSNVLKTRHDTIKNTIANVR